MQTAAMRQSGSAGSAGDHDHQACLGRVLAAAERRCREQGVKLTFRRRRVLEIVARSHKAVGAYDIAESLRQGGRRAAPISVYRALDFLIAQQLVHRLSSVSGYVACSDPAARHGPQFLICGHCGTVAEIASPNVEEAITRGAEGAGFAISKPMIEIVGLCRECRTGS